MTEKKRVEIDFGYTEGGEFTTELREDGDLREFAVGSGEETRGVGFTGEEIVPGTMLAEAWSFSKKGLNKVVGEMEAFGAKKVGRDSPELGRSRSGWSSGNWDQRYGKIFGHEEPVI